MFTGAAAWDYRDRFAEDCGRTAYRRFADGVVSSVGLGTYLGDPNDAVDDGYRRAIETALEAGCNVLDTAINYRCQRSERVVGEALREADVDRDAVLVATKGGFVPFDGDRPPDPGAYVRQEYVEPGLLDPEELVAGSHCLDPAFIEDQLDRSLANLGLDGIDCYYVHNPETQLEARSREAVYDRLEACFRRLERRAMDGDVGSYGLATWECFRVPADHPSHLSLSEVVSRARAAADAEGAPGTHFRAIQCPFNARMADAYTVRAQESATGTTSVLEFARGGDLAVFASVPLAQGALATDGLPAPVADRVSGETAAQRALNFARSAPGVTAALAGSADPEHVRENLGALSDDPLGADAFDATFQ